MIPPGTRLFFTLYMGACASIILVVLIFLATVILYLANQVPQPADPALLCVYVERGEWTEDHGCILQEVRL